MKFILTAGNIYDGTVAIDLISKIKNHKDDCYFVMDKAYISSEIRSFLIENNFIVVVPPKSNTVNPWTYDKQIYKKRNEIERFFLRLKGFRKIFTRYDKLDIMYCAYVFFGMIMILLRSVNMP